MKNFAKPPVIFVLCFTFIISNLYAVVAPKNRTEIPDVVKTFMKANESTYSQNELAQEMEQRRLLREALHREGQRITDAALVPKTLNVPVLVGKFSDSGSDQWNTSELQKELFSGPWSDGTMKQYFLDNSYNQLIVNGSVYGWYTASKKKNDYGKNVYGMPPTGRAPEFVREMLQAADASVDFSQFDNDGDGEVETVFIVHYGRGAEGYNTPKNHPNDIWSHQTKLSNYTSQGGKYKTNDKTSSGKDVYVDTYNIQPAISNDGSSMIEIGIFCHEFGHVLGLGDLYDRDYSTQGIGEWGVMGFGNWNEPESPAHFCAYHKIKLGWITPVEVKHDMTGVSIFNTEQNPTVHKLWTNGNTNGKQYFLVENRQRIGFDRHLNGAGILIWHVDENMPDNDTDSHRLVDLEEADGLADLDVISRKNRGDDSDCYPGSSNNQRFDVNSSPNSKNYKFNDTKCGVVNISTSGATMTADLLVGVSELDVDLLVKDGPNDNGNEPSPDVPWWVESEIWIDNDSDGKADKPAEGMENLLWTKVYNNGSEDAANVKVSFYQSTPSMGLLYPSKANFIDDEDISLLKKNGGSDKVSVKWNIPKNPPKVDHYCIGVIAGHTKDKAQQEKPRLDNNISQINYMPLVKKSGELAPGALQKMAGLETKFRIINDNEYEWPYRIYLDIVDLPRGWSASVDPEQVVIPPRGSVEGTLYLSIPQAQHGDSGYVRIILEDDEYKVTEGGVDYSIKIDDVPPHPQEGLFARGYFFGGDQIPDKAPTVRLDWPKIPEDARGQKEDVVYYKIYRSKNPEFGLSRRTLIDSTAIDIRPDEQGYQWFDSVDLTQGPFYYTITAVDAAGNESEMGNVSPVRFIIYGNVSYFDEPYRPVSETEIVLDGEHPLITNEDGFFEYPEVNAGFHTLEIFKEGDLRNGLDDEDVTTLLHRLAFLHELDEVQHYAADVTEDGHISGADAIALSRYLHPLESYVGETGQWRFHPPAHEFDLYYEKAANFQGLIKGDVNLNWALFGDQSPGRQDYGNFRNLTFAVNRCNIADKTESQSTVAELFIPSQIELVPGTIAEIPVYVSSDSAIGLLQCVIEFDSSVVEFDGLASQIPFIVLSAANADCPFQANSNGTNNNVLVQLFGSGSHSFSGANKLLCKLLFYVRESATNTTPFFFDVDPSHSFLTTLHLTDIAGEQINFIHGSGSTTAVGDDESATKPQQFMLYQNYPNPFNAETVITFDVREKCHVSLKIFDLLGRLQRSLVAREMEPGSHSVRVNSSALSSGVYFYRIEMGGYSAVRKMVVLE